MFVTPRPRFRFLNGQTSLPFIMAGEYPTLGSDARLLPDDTVEANNTPSQLDVFLYTGCEEQVEDVRRYQRNGYHPVLLGDILPKAVTCVDKHREPRYRILLKLGFGAFAAVWLARDLVNR